MRTALVTIAAHRDTHLRLHLQSLQRSTMPPYVHVVVAIGDPGVAHVVAAESNSARVLWVEHDRGPLPLAHARNAGAASAVAAGAELLIFLDVDCIAGTALLSRYVDAARQRHNRAALLCGPVTYLPPPDPSGYDLDHVHELHRPHPARPAPSAGTVLTGTDYDLFWSLSFAVTTSAWNRIGGFCTEYAGYGGEDTDLAYTAAAAGVGLRWVGGADAFHQYHPVSDPPVEHLDDILVNAQLFHRRWGRWPMPGWLRAFEERGLITYDPGCRCWVRST
ncbi:MULTISPECIES: glycosyltransferase family 2 protein [unclassified Rhodococcus (in: high G+C Gram-positive bacteria)]|uniref:glycosyltransferase family 2 protein n=1 Tax=unclassified Rhodococcus (in: high G+C Gram-positive bacteria) TaxID=192944 RepID=UPI00163A8C51|nr:MULTISPECIES: galactosyltransferase-related protein [unclassified Rhodococcus (in: high G+C Gram-positive bacteria)]MBC2641973.1 glycosyltransferase family 2 protein [Rhodococcus sp. 3A]MBC2893286.1 glycosyltransferase family 2 protein [Rhodococcus sp. 4CII]